MQRAITDQLLGRRAMSPQSEKREYCTDNDNCADDPNDVIHALLLLFVLGNANFRWKFHCKFERPPVGGTDDGGGSRTDPRARTPARQIAPQRGKQLLSPPCIAVCS